VSLDDENAINASTLLERQPYVALLDSFAHHCPANVQCEIIASLVIFLKDGRWVVDGTELSRDRRRVSEG
jgi:hypothetical protein